MAGGFGAGAFAAGFGKSLTDVLLQHRQSEQARSDREFQQLLPIHLQLASESGDYSGVENLISEHNPKLAASLKKNSPFANLHQMIGPQLKMSEQQPSMSNATTSPTGIGGLPLPPSEPAPPDTQAEQPPLP